MAITPEEEMAYRLVDLYVREVSQRGEKRQMGLDTIINAYFYTLLRLKKKREEMGMIAPVVEREEQKIEDEVEKITFPEETPALDFNEDKQDFDFG